MNDNTTDQIHSHAREILDYWIGNSDDDIDDAKQRAMFWFGSDSSVDAEIARRFRGTVESVREGGHEDWLDTPAGILATIIVLDQFPRNLYRGTAEAFASDARALELSLALADSPSINSLGWMSRVFALMPLQHSEDAAVQERAVREFESLAAACDSDHRGILEGNAEYARLHRDIVKRFGRFPHRNRILGRESTQAESDWLNDDGPTFGQGG